MVNMRSRVIGVLIAISAVGVAVVPTMASSATGDGTTESAVSESRIEGTATADSEILASPTGCVANSVCGYFRQNYEHSRDVFTCSAGEHGGNVMRSARNRCGNRSAFLMLGGSIVACMNPGGDRPSPGLFSSIIVRGLGSRC